MTSLLALLGIRLPIIQAPMAGVSTPAMAAAVSRAGGLGSLGVGAVGAETARSMIREARAGDRDLPLNVNLFCHRAATAKPEIEAAWIRRLTPLLLQHGASPPRALREIYTTFSDDDAMLAMLLEERPRVVSFHFGLPSAEKLLALRRAHIVLVATTTNLDEARAIAQASTVRMMTGWFHQQVINEVVE